MTRDEFIQELELTDDVITPGVFSGHARSILAHDAEQRQLIESLTNEIELLKADDAERCTLIRDMEEEEQRKDQEIEEARRTAEYWKAEHLAGNTKIEQQAQQIATLKSELSQRTNLEGSAPCWNSAHMKQITTLREALQLLYDVQNGCPLPTYQKDWDRAMELTQQALKEVKE